MTLAKLSELHRFLHSLGTKAKKSLSQNFLIDGNILKKIIKQAEISPGDRVLEIGSGPGVLTEALLAGGAQVIAVEKDLVFATALKRFEKADIFAGDIREFPFDHYFHSLEKKIKVVANLPYHLTTPILSLLVPRYDLFSSLTLMVQEEVARRITALPNSSDYSSLTLFLRFYSTPCYGFKVSSSCFYPAPKVESAVVTLTLHPPSLSSCEEDFFRLVRTAFGQRRKMVRSTLKSIYPVEAIDQAFGELALDPQVRPENLSLEQFIALFNQLGDAPPMRL